MNAHRTGRPASPFSAWERLLYFFVFLVFTVPTLATGRLLRAMTGRHWGACPAPEKVEKILIVQIENLGDFLISAGFLKAVRQTFPQAHITVAVDRKFVDFLSRFPYYDEVLGFDQSGSKYYRLFAGPVRAFRFSRELLWPRHFDLVINQRWDADSKHGGVVGMFALGRYHLGFSSETNPRKHTINQGLNAMFTRTINPPQMVHDGLRGGQLLAALGYPSGDLACELFLTDEEHRFAAAELGNVKYAPLIALGLGANQDRRKLPAADIARIARWVVERWPDSAFLVVGHSGDQRDAEALRPALGDRLLNYAGKCSLGRSAALLKHCSLYVGTDSGPMHMAAAQGVPVVVYSCHPDTGPDDHPHSPFRYAPVGSESRVLRPRDFKAPCHYGCTSNEPHCITGVSVEMVTEAIGELSTHIPRRLVPVLEAHS